MKLEEINKVIEIAESLRDQVDEILEDLEVLRSKHPDEIARRKAKWDGLSESKKKYLEMFSRCYSSRPVVVELFENESQQKSQPPSKVNVVPGVK